MASVSSGANQMNRGQGDKEGGKESCRLGAVYGPGGQGGHNGHFRGHLVLDQSRGWEHQPLSLSFWL